MRRKPSRREQHLSLSQDAFRGSARRSAELARAATTTTIGLRDASVRPNRKRPLTQPTDTELDGKGRGRLSFAPTFHKRHNPVTLEEEDKENEVARNTMMSLTTPAKRKPSRPSTLSSKKHKVVGPLARRLQSLRSVVEEDVMRLQSGMYKASSTDSYNPRKRAKSYVDITVITHPQTVPWTREHAMVTFSCQVHEYVDKKAVDTSTYPDRAWFTCTTRTVRCLKLMDAPTTTVRVYNPEWVVKVGAEDSRPILVCTQLCEKLTNGMVKRDDHRVIDTSL